MDECLKCGMAVRNGCCESCALPFDRGYVVGRREGVLALAIDGYKYRSVRALAKPFGEMMAEVLPQLPTNTVVVPVPTNHQHVRARGLDHTLLMGRELARARGWECERVVGRVKNNRQVGASERVRREQAEGAYIVRGKVHSGVSYVVVDDVWTTGSTMEAVCETLREAGASDITAIVVARA